MDFILIMVICSAIDGNKCQPIPLPLDNFKDHFDCVSFGYDFSHKMITKSFVQQYSKKVTMLSQQTGKKKKKKPKYKKKK